MLPKFQCLRVCKPVGYSEIWYLLLFTPRFFLFQVAKCGTLSFIAQWQISILIGMYLFTLSYFLPTGGKKEKEKCDKSMWKKQDNHVK